MPHATEMPASPERAAHGIDGDVARLTTTGSSRVLEADSASARLLGRSIAALVQKPLAALVDMEDRRLFRSRIASVLREGDVTDWHLRLSGPDGCPIPVVATVRTSNGTNGGVEPKLVWTLLPDARSMTPHPSSTPPRDELAQELAQLVHELNQPLAAITTFVRGTILRLKQGNLTNADLEAALEALADQARRAGAIVRAAGQRWEPPS